MFRNYLTTALRNFNRYRGFSFLNLAGLALGLTASWFIALWVRDEWRHDRFHADGDRIYQVLCNIDAGNGSIATWKTSPEPLHRVFVNDLPEVEAGVATLETGNAFLQDDDILHEKGLWASEDFFTFFTFPLLAGQAAEALKAPDRIAVSAPLADRLFGTAWRAGGEIIGRKIKLKEQEGEFQVSAVFADVPAYSSLRFDYVLPLTKLVANNQYLYNYYGNYFFNTYVRLAPLVDAAAVQAKLLPLVKKHTETSYPGHGYYLQPLTQSYLYSNFENGRPAGGRIDYVRLFSIAAVFILLIACINYMNLATARAGRRAREIGIRKVVGARRYMIFGQFLTESVLTALLGIGLALVLSQALMPAFNTLTGKEIAIDFSQPAFWGLLLGLGLATGLLAGSYPALIMSSFRIINILKGEVIQGFKDINLRRVLVVIQFALAILLIAGAFGVRRQVDFIRYKNLGIDRDNVLGMELPQELQAKIPLVKEELRRLPEVADVTLASDNPLNVGSSTSDPEWEGFSEDKRTLFKVLTVDYNFLPAMHIPIAQGRDFDEAMARDTSERKYLVNETAARAMGLENPIDKRLTFWGDEGRIVGVVRDFHIASLHQAIEPLILLLSPENTGVLFVRPASGQTAGVITALENLYKRLAPQAEFKYEFLDKNYESMYQAELLTGRLADVFAIVAILISCLGLLGLTAFTAQLRLREVCIRKVLGAGTGDLVWLLNRELGLLLAIAFALAVPAAWYLLHGWLSSFNYHAPLTWQPFALAGGLLLLVAVLTVSYHSLRAARNNPAEMINRE